MINDTEISVIIPIYNCEKYLRKAIESVLKQKFNQYELLLINDGSTDNSLKICLEFEEKNENIIVIDKENTGVSDTRNYGISKARGKYIFFMDADDYIEPNAFENLIKIMNKYNPDMITTGFFSEVESTENKISMDKIFIEEKMYNTEEEIKKDFIKMWDNHILYNIWNKLYLKKIIEEYNIKFPDYNWAEDVEFNKEYLMHTKKIYNTSECYYHYVRERQGSATKKYNENLFHVRVNENYDYINFFKKCGLEEKEYIEFIARRYIERTLGCIENLFNSDCKISLKEKYIKVKEIINHEETKKYLYIAQPKSKKISIMLIPYKLNLPILAMLMGKILAIVKEKLPNIFNKLKNRR